MKSLGILVLFLTLSACQYTTNENYAFNIIDNGSTVSSATQSGDQTPAVSRGGNDVTPSGNEIGLNLPDSF